MDLGNCTELIPLHAVCMRSTRAVYGVPFSSLPARTPYSTDWQLQGIKCSYSSDSSCPRYQVTAVVAHNSRIKPRVGGQNVAKMPR